MEKLCVCLVILAVAVSRTLSSTKEYQCPLKSPGKPKTPPHTSGFLVRIHSCNQNRTTCMASGNGHYNSPNTKLNILLVKVVDNSTGALVVCIQIKYNGSNFALKVISPSQVVFQKLMPGKDCKNSNATMFKRKVKGDEKVGVQRWNPVQFISQKDGLPDDAKFLAVNWNHPNGSDPLFLTNEINTQNRFICSH